MHSYLKIRGEGKERGFELTIDSQRTNIINLGGIGDLPCIKVRKLGFEKERKRKNERLR